MRSLALILLLAACGGTRGTGGNETEVITTVTLTFTPTGGPAHVFEFDDPDGDGGDPPIVDDIELGAGVYDLEVGFENRLEDPPEIITDEIADESDEHQIFFTGDAPLDHAYADEDDNGLPIGLLGTVTATPGAGTFTVTLRHLPPINGEPQKVEGVTSGGTVDAQVDFAVAVN